MNARLLYAMTGASFVIAVITFVLTKNGQDTPTTQTVFGVSCGLTLLFLVIAISLSNGEEGEGQPGVHYHQHRHDHRYTASPPATQAPAPPRYTPPVKREVAPRLTYQAPAPRRRIAYASPVTPPVSAPPIRSRLSPPLPLYAQFGLSAEQGEYIGNAIATGWRLCQDNQDGTLWLWHENFPVRPVEACGLDTPGKIIYFKQRQGNMVFNLPSAARPSVEPPQQGPTVRLPEPGEVVEAYYREVK